MKLTHKTTGNVLKIFLAIGIGLSSTIAFTSFLYFYAYDIFYPIASFDQAASLFFTVIWVVASITYLVWIVKIHNDFQKIDLHYPITTGGAIARIIIPFYNFYGLWNIYSTMSKFFDKRTRTALIAQKISLLLPFYYFLFIGTNLLDRFIISGAIMNEGVIMFSFLLDVVLMVILYMMVKTVMNAFEQLSQQPDEKEQLEDEVIEG